MMPLWDGLFRARAGPSPPETPDFGAINTTLSYAATQPAAAGAAAPALRSSSSTTQQQQQWQGAWQAPQQQLRRAGSSGGSLNAAASSSGSLLDAAAAHSQPVRIPEARVLPYSRLRAHSASSSPQSPGVLSRRTGSYNRLSELGTSPGLIEASFMGLAARKEPTRTSSSSSSTRSSTLQQMQQQHAAASGMRVLPGSTGFHWLSRADESESAARGLLGLPRPGFVSDAPQGLVRAGSSGGLTDGLKAQGTAAFDASAASPVPAAAAAASSSGSPFLQQRSLGRRSNSGLGFGRSASGLGLGSLLRSGSSSQPSYPTCLICLDQLTPDDFESGEAMMLDCRCKGEVAMRHRQCAEKWSRIKGSTTCDVCKAPILNLPDVPPLPPPPGQPGNLLDAAGDASLWSIDEPPAAADYIFDCIRVTWVVLIVCLLFFELDVAQSFVTGALLGTVYVALAASWAAARRRGRRQRVVNAAAAWAAGQAEQQRVPLLQGLVGGLEGMPV
ncbi:hypothetical protein OEZ85_012346 [Tetradesmus obliquus]|uniref:RING-CH-type domain-containing protein n=1 Tax=Tetradesmus obliquus TaxID=3088 RepID=A0ABY8TTH2_TETOB|nr:hypothetical protein OEZ85_012346 [Tetradesmus obliquus]